MIRHIVVLIDLNISDRVRVIQAGSVWSIQFSLALLQLFELFKLIICWEREHVDTRLDLFNDFKRVIVLNWLRLLLHLLLNEHILTSSLDTRGAWGPLVLKIDNSATTCSMVMHRISLFALRIAAWLVNIEVGSSRQASTFDFGAKELTNRVVCHLLYGHILVGLVRSLVDLR